MLKCNIKLKKNNNNNKLDCLTENQTAKTDMKTSKIRYLEGWEGRK